MLGFGVAVAACAPVSGLIGNTPQSSPAPIVDRTGPAGDYPVVIGEPFTIDGITYTPADTLNYDEVGYADASGVDAAGITIAHRTLPLPSYVEITALDTGRTILARVERRGPMVNTKLVALSPAAFKQLEAAPGAPVRIRRVNPPEVQRFELRSGREAPLRIDTPAGLLDVLKRRLPQVGSASLRREDGAPSVMPENNNEMSESATEGADQAISSAEPQGPQSADPEAILNASNSGVEALPAPIDPEPSEQASVIVPVPPFPDSEGAVLRTRLPEAVPLPSGPSLEPLGTSMPANDDQNVMSDAEPEPEAVTDPETPAAEIASDEPMGEPARTPVAGDFVVQAGAFSAESTANRVARDIDGYVEPVGRLWRVRKGPFESRGQANEALAKVRGSGYKGAQVYKLR